MWAHPEAKSVLRHGQIVFCQGCNAVMTQLRRNLDENLLQGFSDESMVSFYATCAAQRKGHGGRLSWSSVKASLTNLLTETEMSSYTQRVLGRSLPKSVWLAQGYLEEVIDKQPSYFDTQLGTTVYTVAVKEQEWAEVFTRITQKIMESEARATQRKASGKRKQQDSSLPDLDLPAELGDTASSSKKEKKDKKEEKDRARLDKKLKAANTKLASLAVKALHLLNRPQQNVGGVLQAAQKAEQEELVTADLRECDRKLKDA